MIPRVIHQVWDVQSGPPAPVRVMQTFRLTHPAWHYQLWDCINLPPMMARQQLDWTTLPCKRADIIRLEILYRHGGVYADCDMISLKPMDDLLDTPFFAGYQWVYKNGGFICNALIGAEPYSPLVLAMLKSIKRLTQEQCASSSAINLTGPRLLTREWRKQKIGVIHPPSFFYPIADKQFQNGQLPPDWKAISKDSYTVHLWGGQFTYNYINSL